MKNFTMPRSTQRKTKFWLFVDALIITLGEFFASPTKKFNSRFQIQVRIISETVSKVYNISLFIFYYLSRNIPEGPHTDIEKLHQKKSPHKFTHKTPNTYKNLCADLTLNFLFHFSRIFLFSCFYTRY